MRCVYYVNRVSGYYRVGEWVNTLILEFLWVCDKFACGFTPARFWPISKFVKVKRVVVWHIHNSSRIRATSKELFDVVAGLVLFSRALSCVRSSWIMLRCYDTFWTMLCTKLARAFDNLLTLRSSWEQCFIHTAFIANVTRKYECKNKHKYRFFTNHCNT